MDSVIQRQTPTKIFRYTINILDKDVLIIGLPESRTEQVQMLLSKQILDINFETLIYNYDGIFSCQRVVLEKVEEQFESDLKEKGIFSRDHTHCEHSCEQQILICLHGNNCSRIYNEYAQMMRMIGAYFCYKWKEHIGIVFTGYPMNKKFEDRRREDRPNQESDVDWLKSFVKHTANELGQNFNWKHEGVTQVETYFIDDQVDFRDDKEKKFFLNETQRLHEKLKGCMTPKGITYYDLLGVDIDASNDQIRRAYGEKSKELNQAYATLYDPDQRQAYDKKRNIHSYTMNKKDEDRRFFYSASRKRWLSDTLV